MTVQLQQVGVQYWFRVLLTVLFCISPARPRLHPPPRRFGVSTDYDRAASTKKKTKKKQKQTDGTFLYIVRVVRYTSIIQLVRSQALFIGS